MERTPITITRDEKGDISKDPMDVIIIIIIISITMITINQFFERQNLPELTQEEIDNLNRPVSIEETESKINSIPNRKYQVQMSSPVNSVKYLRNKYQFSAMSSRKCKQMEYFIIHSMRPELPQCQGQTEIL